MKKNTLNKLFIGVVACMVMLAACKTKKVLVERKAVDTVALHRLAADSIKRLKLNAIKATQTDFSYFTGKAKARIGIDGNNNDVTLNIRIKKNEAIWVSVTAVMGIEGARALITPDSIKVINRLDNSYLKKPFAYVHQYTSNEVNFNMLQALLIGNAIPAVLADSASVFKPEAGNLQINGLLGQLSYQLILGPDLKVSTTNMVNSQAGQQLQVNNNVFVNVLGHIIPSQINISSAVGVKKIQVDITYTKTDFDKAIDFPFNVPARFSVVN